MLSGMTYRFLCIVLAMMPLLADEPRIAMLDQTVDNATLIFNEDGNGYLCRPYGIHGYPFSNTLLRHIIEKQDRFKHFHLLRFGTKGINIMESILLKEILPHHPGRFKGYLLRRRQSIRTNKLYYLLKFCFLLK